MDISGKVVLVTGGAGLLGEAFCKAICNKRGTAIIGETDVKRGSDIQEQILRENKEASIDVVSLDITCLQSIQKAIAYISGKYGKIDALVNSAYPRNKNYGRKFEDVEYEDFCQNINLNIGGYFLTSQQFALFFEKQGFGNIINISSIYGVIAPRFEIYDNTPMTMPVEYAAIKSAIIHLTKYLAKYFKGKNIRVNSISPGGIFNKQPEQFISNYNKYTLNKGMLQNNDLTGSLIYLLSSYSECVNGQNIVVDDGFTL